MMKNDEKEDLKCFYLKCLLINIFSFFYSCFQMAQNSAETEFLASEMATLKN